MRVSSPGILLVPEGEPIQIPDCDECLINKEVFSLKKDGRPVIGYLGEGFKKYFFGYKEAAHWGFKMDAHRLMKDANPYVVIEEMKRKHYITPMTVVLYLLESAEIRGVECLDMTGRLNTFFCQGRRGERVVDLIRTGPEWRIIANPLRLSVGSEIVTFKLNRLIHMPL